MPTYLISPENVYDSMGQNPDLMEESAPAVKSAILRAQIKLEVLLGYKLTHETRTDTFCVSGQDGAPLNGRYSLLLTNGFVSQNPAVTVSIANEEFGSYSTAAQFSVDYLSGKVHVPCGDPDGLLGKYLQVSYASGLASNSVPEEIKQALLCFVPFMLFSTSTAQVDPKTQAAQTSKLSSLDSLGADMVADYLRKRRPSNCLKPILTSVTAN